jgi:hypothetical protein
MQKCFDVSYRKNKLNSLKFKFSYFSERQPKVQRVRQGGSQGDGPSH